MKEMERGAWIRIKNILHHIHSSHTLTGLLSMFAYIYLVLFEKREKAVDLLPGYSLYDLFSIS